MSSFGNNNEISSTGGLKRDGSINISIDTAKIIVGKLVELNYQKQINTKLTDIIANQECIIKQDSIAINSLYNNNERCITVKETYRKQRNVSLGVNAGLLILLLTIIL